MKSLFVKLYRKIEEIAYNIHLFIYVFLKAKVHRYFLILLVLILISAALFVLIEAEHFYEVSQRLDEESIKGGLIKVIFWTIITILSHHYYDMFTLSLAGRILVILMIFFSMITVSIFIANVASALTSRKMMENRGIIEITKLKDHYLICGWRKVMGKFLETIIRNNPAIPLKKYVILANIEPNEIELFRQNHHHFKDIPIIRGDHYNENILSKLNVERAKKVLILADETGKDPYIGIDSLTVLTAITIRSISKTVQVTAELTDMSFEKYLRTAYVDEIIYKNEYGHSLLASSLQQVGLTKVINDLLITHQTGLLKTMQIPSVFYEKRFVELKNNLEKDGDNLIIGLIENVGNLVLRKREAVRVAQKTADVSLLVRNLKSAKSIESCLSHLLPEDDYIIPYNSMAIVVERQKNPDNIMTLQTELGIRDSDLADYSLN